MRRYLYQYFELLSVLGAGTPANPGGDFDMMCWIDAPDNRAALEWGYVLLGDYCKARYAHSADGHRHDGSPIRQGEIIEDQETIDAAQQWGIPACRIGEIPEWREPWRISSIRK